MTSISRKASSVERRQRIERVLGVVAVLSLVAGWVFGAIRTKEDLMPAIQQALPEAGYLEEVTEELYRAFVDSSEEELLGYIALGEASGYGGPMVLAVAVSPDGEILGATVASHKETPAWMGRVMENDFVAALIGKQYSESFEIGNDLDGITGATYTTRAIAEAVMRGGHAVAAQVGLPTIEPAKPKIVFGIPEIMLLLLFAVGYFGHKPTFKYKKQLRWASLIAGMIFLGFVYNSPLTIAYINKFLLGFWPQWQTNLYWYFLIGGILFVFTVDNKNPYCEWFCPFGAAQECMGVIGGAKVRSPGRFRTLLKWWQRGLAWGAIFLALFFRNPGLTSYEIFGTLFELISNNVQFVLLGLVLLASLFIRRPWCTYLCPLHPVEEFIRMSRKWVKGIWPQRKQTV